MKQKRRSRIRKDINNRNNTFKNNKKSHLVFSTDKYFLSKTYVSLVWFQ